VARIDRTGKRVELRDGDTLSYEKLILATGGRPRRMSVAGTEPKNVFHLWSIGDVEF
jgi:3-phenylpropionate/trans-cinnamate dioxygenase ferredoxin reductase subunit